MPAIACTSCKRSLTVADNLVGKAIKCPVCAATFVAGNGASNGTKSPAPPAAPAAKPPAAAAKSVTLPCNQCKKPLTIPETLLGKGVKCPQCAAVFTAQAPQVKTTAAQPPKPTSAAANAPAAAAKSVTLPCNQCKKPLTIPETLLGKAVKCPQCATVFTAQQPGKPVAASAPAAAKPPVPAPPASPPGLVNLTCDACKKPLRLPEKLIGSAVKCPHCAGVFTAKKPGTPAPAAAPPAATKPTAPPPAVPAATRPTAPPPVPAKPPVPTTPIAAKPPAPPVNSPRGQSAGTGDPKVTIHCVRCKRPLRLPEAALGKPLRCPRCRMIFAAKPKPPDAASWINYPLEKSEAPSPKGSPSAPPKSSEPSAPPPGKVVRIEPLAAVPPLPDTPKLPDLPFHEAAAKLDAAAVPPVTPDEVTEWESATDPGLGDAERAAEMPISHEEPVAETPISHEEPAPEIAVPRTEASNLSTESAEDVFAAYMPKKKKKKKAPPPPPPVEETPAEPEHAAAESNDAEPIPFAPENVVTEGEAPAETFGDGEAEAPVEEVGDEEGEEVDEGEHPHGEDKSGGSAAKWFAVGLFLGGLSAAGVGALFVFHVV